MRRAPLPDLELRRAVWRHEYGYLSATRVGRVLATQMGAAAERFHSLRARRGVVEARHPELLHRWDEARGRGDDARRRGHFRAALEQLLLGRRVLDEMDDLLDADAEAARADASVEWLKARAAVPRLRALPSVRAPAQLLEASRAALDERRWRAAGALARAAHEQAAPLQARGADPDGGAGELPARLREVRELCGATRVLLPEGAADLTGDGTLATLETLLAEGFTRLVRRLADEMELVLAPRSQLLRELRRAGNGGDAAVPAALRSHVAQLGEPERWTHATRWLWHARLAGPGTSGADRPFPAEPAPPAAQATL